MKNEFSKEFTGYVLVGGKSSRMGADKAFLQINGETFIERAVKTLASVCSSVKIVLNQSQKDLISKLPAANIQYIYDIYENRGACGGLHAAFADCQTEYAFILAIDLPNATVRVIKKIAKIAYSADKFSSFVPQQTDGKLQPLCAVYRSAECLPLIEKLLVEKNSVAVRDFIELANPQIIAQKILDVKDKDVFFNVNCPKDYQTII